MIHRLKISILTGAALLCWGSFPLPLPAAAQRPSCEEAPEYKQFDFWVGEWDVTAQGQTVATSSIQKVVGSCVVMENYTQAGGYVGKSMNFYDSMLRKWRQTYVDNTGRVAEYMGEYRDGAMRFTGEAHLQNGQTRLSRMILTNLSSDKVRQQADTSTDGGKTWRTVVDLLYVRKK